MAIPIVTIVNLEKTKLSDEIGFQTSDITFSFDIPCVSYSVRCNGTSYNTGWDIETKDLTVARFSQETVASLRNFTVIDMRIISANSEITVEILYTDLYQEGENRINIYGLSETLEWTPYDSPQEEPPPEEEPPPPTEETLVLNFVDKVKGSNVANPHYSTYVVGYDLPPLSTINLWGDEFTTDQYSRFAVKENNSALSTSFLSFAEFDVINWYFKFDMLSTLERKYGAGIWGGAGTVAEKTAIAKSKITALKFIHHGYGASNSAGGSAGLSFAVWKGSSYNTPVFIANGTNSSVFTTKEWDFSKNDVTNDGFIHILTYPVYDDQPIQTIDYVELQITVSL